MMVQLRNPSYLESRGRRIEVQASLGEVRKTLSQKYNTNKRAGGVVK
jgi:hypothetical protein